MSIPPLLSYPTPRKVSIPGERRPRCQPPLPNVPSSLMIESVLASSAARSTRRWPRIRFQHTVPDYEYDQHSGHVADYPSYTGSLNVLAVLGWKGVFVSEDDSDDEEDETGSAKGLGTRHGAVRSRGPPRPLHPSMTWLM